ncbi:MAG: thiamine pyrophosphate-dependent dehydrogenase E1 component subunit alpha [Gemmatimonadota bacterium]
MSTLSATELRDLYRYLYLTRALEERFENLFKQGQIVGGLYRSLGQEATAVGTAWALEEGDWLAPSIRDLGAILVRGVEPRLMLRQYMARDNPFTGGRDNTTHFNVPELGIFGPISPLGTQLSVLNGVALAFKMADRDRVCLAYQGDGASRTGTHHEAMNFAAVQELPMVAVLEHNRWAFSTPSDREAAVEEWTDVAAAYGVPVTQVDGNDVLEVYDATRRAVERARGGDGMQLVVAETYRMLGHAQHDDQEYVPEEELEAWRERDPLDRYERYLEESGVADADERAEIRAEVDDELDEAVSEALNTPRPEPREAGSRVWADEAGPQVPWTRRSPVGYDDAPSGVEPAPEPGGSG